MSCRLFGLLDPFVGASLYFFCASIGLSQSYHGSFVLSFALAQTRQFLLSFFHCLYSFCVSIFFCALAMPLRVGYACLRVFLRGHFIVLLSFIYLRTGGALAAYAPCLRQHLIYQGGSF